MKRVLVIADNFQQQDPLWLSLQLDKTVHVTVVDAQQTSARRLSQGLRALRKTDLVLLDSHLGRLGKFPERGLLSSLKATGIPIVVLPSASPEAEHLQEPLVLNLAEQDIIRFGLESLLNKIKAYYLEPDAEDLEDALLRELAQNPYEEDTSDNGLTDSATGMQSVYQSPESIDSSSKVTNALIAIRRVSNQLREPLSNMNLAIHMLGQVQSVAEQERYLKLLREEYNRELQLLNQLDNLQANLPPAFSSAHGKG
ncbi:MAG: hypothetical protein F6K42_17350 [Leptolyngbya sp. SIO1D8]|nr:hypothetical protein [Leptolyngbya sp. SIO1D8]